VKKDNITAFGIDQTTIDNELSIPGLITRGPASDGFDVGPILVYNTSFLNIARQRVEAYDFAVDYRLDTQAFGAFTFSTAATRNVHNVRQVIPTLPSLESVGLGRALKWQANASLTWGFRDWTATWVTRWYDSYCLTTGCAESANTLSQGSTSVQSQTYHDLAVAWRLNSATSGIFANTELQLGVKNVFNTSPPIITTAPYYSTQGDPRRSSYYLAIRKSFF
jgi:hypothetical protein